MLRLLRHCEVSAHTGVAIRCPQKACFARYFDLLRNSPHSSILIHFGVELLVLTALLTSASLSKKSFLAD